MLAALEQLRIDSVRSQSVKSVLFVAAVHFLLHWVVILVHVQRCLYCKALLDKPLSKNKSRTAPKATARNCLAVYYSLP